MKTKGNPYTAKLSQGKLTKFQRNCLKQRERGWNDFKAGKYILAYYDAPMRPMTERGRADYNLGWRSSKAIAEKNI